MAAIQGLNKGFPRARWLALITPAESRFWLADPLVTRPGEWIARTGEREWNRHGRNPGPSQRPFRGLAGTNSKIRVTPAECRLWRGGKVAPNAKRLPRLPIRSHSIAFCLDEGDDPSAHPSFDGYLGPCFSWH